MKRHLFVNLLLVFLLTSCNPRVVTDMLTNEWPATSPDSVHVFHKTDVVPQNSQTIGKVKVVDTGFSTKGSFDLVMTLAINELEKNESYGIRHVGLLAGLRYYF